MIQYLICVYIYIYQILDNYIYILSDDYLV